MAGGSVSWPHTIIERVDFKSKVFNSLQSSQSAERELGSADDC